MISDNKQQIAKINLGKKVYFELNFSDMDSEARMSSPDHLVSRKTILERIGGLQEISGHSRHHNSSRLVLLYTIVLLTNICGNENKMPEYKLK